MPRVNSAVKSTRGEEVTCGRCGVKIEPGQKYFFWSFRYGPKKVVRCEKHPPRQSELTQSKMSGAYAAIEDVEDTIAVVRISGGVDSLVTALNSAADDIDGVKDEYQESLDNMGENLAQGSTGQDIQEKIDGLESFAESLRGAAEEIEEMDVEPEEEGESEGADEGAADKKEEVKEEAIQRAEDALGEFSL